ncbi:MAG: YihY/virulence factor BrkB family protein, partial [Thermoplasmatota archaeon]
LALFGRSWREWGEDKAPRQAAALAYYALFALGPLLLVALFLAGLVFGADAASQALGNEFGRLLGKEGASALHDLMAGATRTSSTAWGIAVGGVMLVLGAGGVFAQLRESLNIMWEVQEKTPEGWKEKVVTAVRRNFLGFAAVLGVGFLLIMGLAVNAAVAAVASHAQSAFAGPPILWQALSVVLTVLVLAGAFALMFKFLPNARVAWPDVLFGASVTAVLFVVGEALIGLYLSRAATATRYGAAGAVLVILLWLYYSCLILLYGAELTQVYSNLHGSHIRPTRKSESIAQGIAQKQGSPGEEGTRGRMKEKKRKERKERTPS